MTTLVANSSGRSGGGKAVRKNQTSNASHSVGDHISQKDNNEKFQPTAEQMRIASLMSDKKDAESDLKPKIDKIVELTGATRDDAAIALYDCDNDMAKAIDRILDGEALESEWQSTGKKKKQKNPSTTSTAGASTNDQASSANVNGQKNGDERKFDKSRRERTNGFEENGSGDYKSGDAGGKSLRGKRDPNFKPRGDRRGGGFAGASTAYSRTDNEDASEDRDDRFNGEGGAPRRGGFNARGRGGSVPGRGRGAPRGRGGGRGGSRTYAGRGAQGSDKPVDEFLGSIDTWTNEPKPDEAGGTLQVGNWSDINSTDQWTTDNWNESVDNKVFGLNADKSGPQAPASETQKQASNVPTQMSFLSAVSKSIEKESQKQQQQQQTQQQVPQPSQASTQSSNFATISSPPNKRPDISAQQQQSSQHPQHTTSQSQQQQQQQPQSQSSKQPSQTQVNAGRALLNHIQQPQAQQQQPQQQAPPPNLKQQNAGSGLGGMGGLFNNNKTATESLKSLVGLSANTINENLSSDKQSSNVRMNSGAQNQRSKAQDSAVEMPSNDVANVALSFGSLDFGPNSQSNFSNIAPGQDNIFEAPPKSEKNLSSLIEPNQPATGQAFRSSAPTGPKNVLSSLDVLGGDKINVGSGNYNQKKNDYNIMGGYGKNSYSSDSFNSGAPAYNQPQQQQQQQQQQQHVQPNYYNPNQFNMMQAANNFPNYGNNVNSVPVPQQAAKDGSAGQQSGVSGSSTATSAAPNSGLGLIANSTNTTNVLKNTMTATGKGAHNNNNSNANMPPGVPNFAQVPVQTQYLPNNLQLPFMYGFDYTRDGYSNYPSDMKYNRGSEADMNNASSQGTVGVQSIANQPGGHNQPQFIPGMGTNLMSYFYSSIPNFANPHFPYQQLPQSTVTNPIFPKSSATSSYTHSYNSGYENLGGGSVGNANAATGNVGQSQDYGMKPSYGPQQMSHSKTMQSNSGSDLSGSNQGNTNGQSMYNKSHSQMNKNFDKQNVYQQNNQFMGGSNGLGYGGNNSYLLQQQQPMHIAGDQASGQQTGGAGGPQRSMKGNSGGAPNQNFTKLWN